MPSCPECDKTFSRPFTLKRHMMIVHSPPAQLYTCETCFTSMERRDLLERHKKTHTGEKAYPCEYCQRAFGRSDQLKTHMLKCRMRLSANARDDGEVESVNNHLALNWGGPGFRNHWHFQGSRNMSGPPQPVRFPPQVIQMPGDRVASLDLLDFDLLWSNEERRYLVTSVERAFKKPGLAAINRVVQKLPVSKRSLITLDVLYQRDMGTKFCNLVALAAHLDRTDIVGALIDAGVNIWEDDDCDCQALHVAARNGNARMVELLLDYGVDIDIAEDEMETFAVTPLSCAVVHNRTEVIALLVRRGACLDAAGEDRTSWDRDPTLLLDTIFRYPERDFYEMLMDACARSTTKGGFTVLHSATRGKCNEDAIQALLDRGANVNAISTDQFEYMTPLCCAAEEGSETWIKILLKHGATANGAPGDLGTTPLIQAAQWGYIHILKDLIEAGADVNLCRPSRDGNRSTTVLGHLCDKFIHHDSELECCELLVKAGADVNLGDPKPLANALKWCKVDVVDLLLTAGADPTCLPAVCRSNLLSRLTNPTDMLDAADFQFSWDAGDAYRFDTEAKVRLLEKYDGMRTERV